MTVTELAEKLAAHLEHIGSQKAQKNGRARLVSDHERHWFAGEAEGFYSAAREVRNFMRDPDEDTKT